MIGAEASAHDTHHTRPVTGAVISTVSTASQRRSRLRRALTTASIAIADHAAADDDDRPIGEADGDALSAAAPNGPSTAQEHARGQQEADLGGGAAQLQGPAGTRHRRQFGTRERGRDPFAQNRRRSRVGAREAPGCWHRERRSKRSCDVRVSKGLWALAAFLSLGVALFPTGSWRPIRRRSGPTCSPT